MDVEVLEPELLLLLLNLTSEEQPLVVEVKDLRDLHYDISEGLIKHLLVSSNEAIDDLFMLKTELNDCFQSLVLSHLLVFDLVF